MGDVTLLPCPFCGGEAEMEDTDFCSWCAQCTNEYCKVGPPETGFHATTELCIAAWNTRALTPAQQAAEEMVEALVKIATSPHMAYDGDAPYVSEYSSGYAIGVVDGHRCAANTAAAALAKAGKP